jgi:transcriptional regulator of heat shock response
LVELTRNVGIAAALPAVAQELDQIELVPLSDRRVMMILATRDRMVRNRVVSLDQELSQEELASIRNYVNRNFSGWQLGEARRELLRRMPRSERCTTPACGTCRSSIRRACWMWTSRRKCTWKARRICSGWICI